LSDPEGRIGDGALAFEMFRRFGGDCLNDLRGAYAFAYYDKRQKKLSLVLDATGNRCLYYRLKDGILFFSTLAEPILLSAGSDGINGRWITDYLAADGFAINTEAEETPYANVFLLISGHIVTVENGQISKRRYWNPDFSELTLENDEAYAALVKDTLKKSILCVMRDDKTCLMLSGGLDSSAVACYAARELKKENRTLYTYTSVPEAGYTSKLSNHFITDERDRVLKTKEYLENLGCHMECAFVDMPGINGWDSRSTERNILEFPHKSMQNLIWLIEIMHMVYANGSRIILNAGYGNITISLNHSELLLYDLLRKKQYIEYSKQLIRFGRTSRWGRFMKITQLFRFWGEFLLKPSPKKSGKKLFGGSFVSSEALKKYDVKQRFYKKEKEDALSYMDYQEYKKGFVQDKLFSQLGLSDTKHSLYTGVISRDPTRDVRMVEMILRLPVNQSFRDGINRRLVREYMKEDMPPHVTRNRKLGLQSADGAERMAPHWDRIYREIAQIFRSNMDNPFVDCNKALRQLEELKDTPVTPKKQNSLALNRFLYTAQALEFVQETSINYWIALQPCKEN